jgi:hypothetical protein
MNVNNNNRNKIAGLAVVTILLITAMTVTTLNQTVFAHKHHSKYNSDKLETQTLAQANNSGNGVLPVSVFSHNSASQVQGKHNIVNVSGHQP